MSRTSFSISYHCRESKKNRQGLAPLELCICVNQQRLFLNLPTKFIPREFNKKRKPQYIDDILNQYRIKTNEVIAQLLQNNLPITASTIREYMRSGGTKSLTVKNMIDKYIEQNYQGLSSNSEYKTKMVAQFVNEEIGDRELVSIEIGDLQFLYMKLQSMYLVSTASAKMAKVKSFFQFAFDNGYIKTNLCSNIKLAKSKASVKYLRNEDIDSIKSLELCDYERLEKVRDLLLFQSSSGMAYADLVRFDSSKIEYINGVPTYSNARQKTDVDFTTVILGDGIKVLEKYNGQLPLISNQKYNAYLKEIQRLAKIDTIITTHLLRKTYAHRLLNSGVRVETVAKCLGHSKISTTLRHYARISNETVANEISSLNII